MEQHNLTSRHTSFKIYVSVLLTLIMILLAAILACLVYGGIQLRSEGKTVTSTISGFNKQLDTVNSNLQNLKSTTSLPSGFSY